ncbi:MAG TPA: cytochrome c oxidase assembly protein [Vicinamibacterales bacterium]
MQWWCSALGEAWEWTWRPYPGVWAFLALILAAYILVLRGTPAAATEARDRGTRAAVFGAAVAALWLVLDWPVGALGAGYLASAHMVQFLVIVLVAPPLLLYGVPAQAYRRLPPRVIAVLRPITHPLVALILSNLLAFATHLPLVADRLLASQLGSFAIDVAWLAAGLLFWWPVAAPVPERPWFRGLSRIGYLGAQLIASKPLFIYLTFTTYPRYATYELAPRVLGITARADQQAAGLMMEIGGMLILLAAAGILLLRSTAGEEALDGTRPPGPATDPRPSARRAP